MRNVEICVMNKVRVLYVSDDAIGLLRGLHARFGQGDTVGVDWTQHSSGDQEGQWLPGVFFAESIDNYPTGCVKKIDKLSIIFLIVDALLKSGDNARLYCGGEQGTLAIEFVDSSTPNVLDGHRRLEFDLGG